MSGRTKKATSGLSTQHNGETGKATTAESSTKSPTPSTSSKQTQTRDATLFPHGTSETLTTWHSNPATPCSNSTSQTENFLSRSINALLTCSSEYHLTLPPMLCLPTCLHNRPTLKWENSSGQEETATSTTTTSTKSKNNSHVNRDHTPSSNSKKQKPCTPTPSTTFP